jgi:hypothetical protein
MVGNPNPEYEDGFHSEDTDGDYDPMDQDPLSGQEDGFDLEDESDPMEQDSEVQQQPASEPWVIEDEPFYPQLRFPTYAAAERWIQKGDGPQRQLARRIVYALHAGIIPCSESRHAAAESQHRLHCTKHLNLQSTFAFPSRKHPPSECESTEGFGLYRETPDIPRLWISNNRDQFPNHHRLERLFSGAFLEEEQICLHRHTHPELQVSVKDVDSSILLFFSLNRITEPISLAVVPQPASLLTRSIHLFHPVPVAGGMQKVPIHKIPHMLFATAGTRSHPIFVFFPGLYNDHPDATTHIRDKIYKFFYEKIIRPGLLTMNYRARSTNLPAGRFAETSQHLPASFDLALAESRAQAEQPGNRGGTRGRPTNITFTPSLDPQIWNEMRQQLRVALHFPVKEDGVEPGHLRGLFFLYDSKGTKVETQRERSLTPCIENFRKSQDVYLPDALAGQRDQQYLDIAASIHAMDNILDYNHGCTLLAKRCCAYNTLSTILGEADLSRPEEQHDGDEPSLHFHPPKLTKVVVTEYPVNHLRDTISLTAELRPTHPHAAHGLVYIQTYSPVKELFDAKGVFPFSHHGIMNLGYSEKDTRTMHKLQQTNEDRSEAKTADCRSRKRIKIALEQDDDGSRFGWRLELRVSLELAKILEQEDTSWEAFLSELFQGTQRKARSRATTLVPAPLKPLIINDITIPSRAFYVHKTEQYKAFLRGNIQKHLVAIDSIRALHAGQSSSSMASAALHALLVLSLRNFIAPVPFKEAWVLNNDISTGGTEKKGGLGLAATRQRYGFAFLPPDIINWRELKLKAGYGDKITIPNFKRAAGFRKTEQYVGTRVFLDQLLELITNQAPAPVCEFLMEKCVHLLLQEYREVALAKLLTDSEKRLHCSPSYWASGRMFSFGGISKVAGLAGLDVSRVKGNKMAFKRADLFFSYLWTDEPSTFKRDYITALSFLTLAGIVRQHLARTKSKYATPARFQTILGYRFFEQHTAVPYPNSNGSLVQVNKKHARVLLCFRPLDAVQLVPRNIPLSQMLERVVIDKTGEAILPNPAPVPGCLDSILSADEAKEWLSNEINLLCYQ